MSLSKTLLLSQLIFYSLIVYLSLSENLFLSQVIFIFSYTTCLSFQNLLLPQLIFYSLLVCLSLLLKNILLLQLILSSLIVNLSLIQESYFFRWHFLLLQSTRFSLNKPTSFLLNISFSPYLPISLWMNLPISPLIFNPFIVYSHPSLSLILSLSLFNLLPGCSSFNKHVFFNASLLSSPLLFFLSFFLSFFSTQTSFSFFSASSIFWCLRLNFVHFSPSLKKMHQTWFTKLFHPFNLLSHSHFWIT